MADEFYLDESRFRNVTSDVRGTGDDLTTAYQTLSGTLDQFVGCWGDDDIGKAFEGNYWENAQLCLTGLKAAGPGLVETADNVQVAADNLADVDEETAEYLDSQVPDE